MTVDTLALDATTRSRLLGVATGTLTTVLLKKGLRNVWLRGTMPLAPGQPRLVGRAFTLRFVSAREDLATPALAEAAVEQERLERWIMGQVNQGVPLPGLYPPNAETQSRYDAWASAQGPA